MSKKILHLGEPTSSLTVIFSLIEVHHRHFRYVFHLVRDPTTPAVVESSQSDSTVDSLSQPQNVTAAAKKPPYVQPTTYLHRDVCCAPNLSFKNRQTKFLVKQFQRGAAPYFLCELHHSKSMGCDTFLPIQVVETLEPLTPVEKL